MMMSEQTSAEEESQASGADLLGEILSMVIEGVSQNALFDEECVNELTLLSSKKHLSRVTELKRILQA